MTQAPDDAGPRRRRSRSTPAAPPPDRPLTVSAVAELVRQVLAAAVPTRLRVVGEVSNFSDRTHWFFSLKDEAATLRCVCFASTARRLGFRLRDGLEVVCTGRLDYYDAQGSLQLYVDHIAPVGEGGLELRFRQLCAELRNLGYFDPERKRPLPAMPRRVAVVTSRTGAALQDVIKTVRQRWPGCELALLDVHVQGASAAPEIAAALAALSEQGEALRVDAILLTRGGGSIEDLWAFNEREVADAVYRCRLPVVAAIGHETDTTIAELVADARASTPTQAAMMLVPDRRALGLQVEQMRRRLDLLARRELDAARQRLRSLATHPALSRPERLVQPLRERLDALRQRLLSEPSRRLRTSRDKLAALARQLEAVSPLNVLQRGYSMTLGPEGQVLRSPDQVRPGQSITSVLAEGRLSSEVLGDGKSHRPGAAPTHPRRRPRHSDDAGPSLFGQDPREP